MKLTTIRLKKSGRAPDFSTDAEGHLNVLVHDLELELPVPPGELLGPSAEVLSCKIAEARFVLSWKIEPASAKGEVRLMVRVESFEPGPNTKVAAINAKESDAVPLGSLHGNLFILALRRRLETQPIEVPLSKLRRSIPGYSMESLESLGLSSFLRVGLSPGSRIAARSGGPVIV